jgi:hypothetical protein
MKYELRKRNKKAISDAVVVLLLVIAGVIIAILVVGFAFGIFTGSASGAQITVSSATYKNNTLTLSITNKGSTNFVTPSTITVIYNGVSYQANLSPTSTINPGSTSTVTYAVTISTNNFVTSWSNSHNNNKRPLALRKHTSASTSNIVIQKIF